MIQSLGKVVVPSAGTPIQVTVNNFVPFPTGDVKCHSFMVQAWFNNTGKVWVGNMPNFSKITGRGLVAVIPIPTTNLIQSFSATIASAVNTFNMIDIWIDVDVSNEAALVAVVIQ